MNINLLILEKDPAFRRKLACYLHGRNISVFPADGAEKALKILEEGPVDVALVGVHRPGREGANLIKMVRRASPETAVILVSRELSVSFSMEGMRLGAFDEFLVPFSMAALAGRIREAYGDLKKRGGACPEPVG